MIEGQAEKDKTELKKQNMLLHLQGQYMAEAILSTVGNMLSGKNSKKHKYPEKPYDIFENTKEFTEEELQAQRNIFVAKLQIMKSNFEIEKDS